MDKKENIVIEYLNAQSLLCHIDEIRFLVEERNVDILCVSETWLHETDIDLSVNINNFHIYRCDKGRGGGTCIYVRNNLLVNILEFEINNDDVEVEDIWLTIQYRKFPSFVVGCIYRHPHALVTSFN